MEVAFQRGRVSRFQIFELAGCQSSSSLRGDQSDQPSVPATDAAMNISLSDLRHTYSLVAGELLSAQSNGTFAPPACDGPCVRALSSDFDLRRVAPTEQPSRAHLPVLHGLSAKDVFDRQNKLACRRGPRVHEHKCGYRRPTRRPHRRATPPPPRTPPSARGNARSSTRLAFSKARRRRAQRIRRRRVRRRQRAELRRRRSPRRRVRRRVVDAGVRAAAALEAPLVRAAARGIGVADGSTVDCEPWPPRLRTTTTSCARRRSQPLHHMS